MMVAGAAKLPDQSENCRLIVTGAFKTQICVLIALPERQKRTTLRI